MDFVKKFCFWLLCVVYSNIIIQINVFSHIYMALIFGGYISKMQLTNMIYITDNHAFLDSINILLMIKLIQI